MSVDAIKSTVSAGGGLARPNKFHVELPTIPGSDLSTRDLNLLCRTASLPSKQISTLIRQVGMENEKMGYGYVVDDVNVSFLLLNDYKVKRYFDQWRKLIVDEEAQTVGYKDTYQRRVVIHQLKVSAGETDRSFIRADNGITTQTVGRPFFGENESVYSVELINAFPVTVNAIEFNSDADAFLELSVSFAYTNWREIDTGQKFWNL